VQSAGYTLQIIPRANLMALSSLPVRLLAAAAILAITTLAFWPGLTGGFLFDDYPNIVQKSSVHASEISLEEMAKAAKAYQGTIGRPLATISFALNHAMDGLNPWGYKLGGLLVHLVNSLLVFLLVQRLLALTGDGQRSHLATASVITAVWAVHPLQVSAVLYVVQRMETLSLTFVLVALLAYIRGRQNQQVGLRAWPWLGASMAMAAMGLLSKETAALFPAYTLALELTLLRFSAQDQRVSRALRAVYAAGVAAAVGLFFLVVLPHYGQAEVYAVRDYGMGERVLTQLRVLPMYLGWIVLPQPASYHFYYDNFVASQGLLSPVSTLLGGLLVLGLAAAAIGARHRLPLFSLGIMWFFISHMLTSNIVNLELVFEHRNYFAILGVALAIAALLQRLPAGEMPQVRTVGMVAIVGGLLMLTLIRSATWGDPTTLAKYLSDRNPGSSRASTDLGEQYMVRAGRDPTSPFYEMAAKEFERGSRIPGSSPMPEQGLLILAATAGQPADPAWWDRIIHKLETRAIGPQELSMITGLLEKRQNGLEFDDGRFADAYLVLVNRMQVPWFQYYAFGEHALLYLKDEALADGLYRRAVENAADQPEAVAAMVEAMATAGHLRQAQSMADHARELGIADITLPASTPEPKLTDDAF
jgi:hypothetical protein